MQSQACRVESSRVGMHKLLRIMHTRWKMISLNRCYRKYCIIFITQPSICQGNQALPQKTSQLNVPSLWESHNFMFSYFHATQPIFIEISMSFVKQTPGRMGIFPFALLDQNIFSMVWKTNRSDKNRRVANCFHICKQFTYANLSSIYPVECVCATKLKIFV